MSNIDQAEAALAVIGVDAVISRAVEKVSASQRKDIRNLGKMIKSRVSTMLATGVSVKYPLPPDYMQLLTDLTESMDQEQIQKTISFLPDDVQMPFMAIAGSMYSRLQEEIPKRVSRSTAGERQLTVDDPDYFRFYWVYSVLDNPMRVIDLIGNGSLLRVQAEAVKEFYPTISEAIDDAIDEVIPALRAKDKNFELPMETEIGLNVWRGLPVIEGEYQSMYYVENKQRDADPKPSDSQLSNSAAATVSSADALLYPKAT